MVPTLRIGFPPIIYRQFKLSAAACLLRAQPAFRVAKGIRVPPMTTEPRA